MQTLVVFKKENRQVVATFRMENIVTGMKALLNPEYDYAMTSKPSKDIFREDSHGNLYLKLI